MKFVFTKSKETAESLKRKGLQVVSETDDGYFFINDSKFTFSKDENVTFTNKLFV